MILKCISVYYSIFNLFASIGIAQPEHQLSYEVLLNLADQYGHSRNFNASITEYKRFLFFHPNHPHAFYAHYKTAVAFRQLQQLDDAISHFRRALQSHPPSELVNRIRYQYSLLLIEMGEYDLAQLELFKIATKDSAGPVFEASMLLQGLLWVFKQNWSEAIAAFSRLKSNINISTEAKGSLVEIERRLYELNEDPKIKSPKLAKWLSTLLPGSGQAYANQPFWGLNALALNSLTTYSLWQTYERRNVRDMVLVFSFLWLRYYLGNRLHAEEAAIRANQSYKREKIQQIYELLKLASPSMSSQPLTIERHHLSNLETSSK